MKREKACVDGRRNRILEIMRERPQVRVDELAKLLEVSVVTVRRDLQYLEEKNQLIRVYGGAVAVQAPEDQVDEVKIYRDLIARYAASLVEDGDTLFINTSRNARQVLRYITKKNVTVITNNGRVIDAERGPGVHVILTGGELRYPKEAMVGDYAIRNLQTVIAKKSFIGCSGIDSVNGMTTENANEVTINQLMVRNVAEESYILADHTKLGKSRSFISCPIEEIKHLITDEKAPADVVERLRAKGVTVHLVRREDFPEAKGEV